MRQPLFPAPSLDADSVFHAQRAKGGSFDQFDENTGGKSDKQRNCSSATTQVAGSVRTKEDESDLNMSFEEDFFLEIRGGIDLDD